jgi:ABC-type branched-subunit amino acid transport system substrate-binding protein
LPPAEQPAAAGGPLPEDDDRYQTPPPPQKSDVPRVAILLPLSGPHAAIGQALLNASQLALFHFADKRFELLPQDTRGTANGAADAAALAIGDGASLILGPLFAASVEAIAPAARAADVTVIAFSNDRRVVGNRIFTMGFLPGEQVDRVMRYAYRQGLRNFALLAPDNDYGTAVAAAMNDTATALSAAITRTEFYDPLAEDLRPVVRNLADYDARRRNLLDERNALKSRNDEVARVALKRLANRQTLGDVSFDALLIAAGGKRLEAIAALLPHFDIDPKQTRMLGTGQWDVSGIGREPALLDAWFAAPPPGKRAEFIAQYKQTYGKSPARIATLAYDATAIAAVFARDGGKFDLSEILSPQGFTGRDGLFRFLVEGITQRGLTVQQVKRTRNQVIDPPPTGFGPPIN